MFGWTEDDSSSLVSFALSTIGRVLADEEDNYGVVSDTYGGNEAGAYDAYHGGDADEYNVSSEGADGYGAVSDTYGGDKAGYVKDAVKGAVKEVTKYATKDAKSSKKGAIAWTPEYPQRVLFYGVITLYLILVVELVRHAIDHAAKGRPFFNAVLMMVYSERTYPLETSVITHIYTSLSLYIYIYIYLYIYIYIYTLYFSFNTLYYLDCCSYLTFTLPPIL